MTGDNEERPVPEIVVLEHTRAAGPSAFTEVLDGRAAMAPWRRVDVPAGEALPEDLGAVAGLLVMGGVMSAVDPGLYPWMAAELELLRRAVESDVPVLGVCLGAQLLGAALGGEVAALERPEVGFLPMHLTEDARGDQLIAGWPDGAPALMVHEDEVVSLPPGAVALLSGGDGVPAWRVGQAWAVQFHPEVTPEQLADWAASGLLETLLVRSGVDVEALLSEAVRRGRFTVPQGLALVGRFLDGPVRRRLSG